MFEVQTLGGASTVLRLEGELDFYCREPFGKAVKLVADSGAERLVISLEGCRYIDCSGIGVLIAARKALGSRLRIVIRPQTLVHRMFDLLELTELLEVVSTIDEALARPIAA